MGLLKSLTNGLKKKAKEELEAYIKQVLLDEKQQEEKKEGKKIVPKEAVESSVEPTKKEQTEEKTLKIPKKTKKEEKKEEWIPQIVSEEIERYTLKKKVSEIVLDKEVLSIMQDLNLEETALYLKLYLLFFEKKKNYAYLGKSTKKAIGLLDMENKDFDYLVSRLEKRGILEVEEISPTQRMFVLYVPFNEEIMDKAVKSKTSKKSSSKNKEETLPGQADNTMNDDSLKKAYLTFVSLEIDKAKMRVGRSNFDKIYMEAVKYIDKKYGFKVLSDSEKFKEYLNQYYISAFDIKTFDEWKKNYNK